MNDTTGDGEPGPMTLWRGLPQVNNLTAMWRLFETTNVDGKWARREAHQWRDEVTPSDMKRLQQFIVTTALSLR